MGMRTGESRLHDPPVIRMRAINQPLVHNEATCAGNGARCDTPLAFFRRAESLVAADRLRPAGRYPAPERRKCWLHRRSYLPNSAFVSRSIRSLLRIVPMSSCHRYAVSGSGVRWNGNPASMTRYQ